MESSINAKSGFQSHWRLFVNIAKAFCVGYLILYVVVPFCRGVMPPDAWGIDRLALLRAKLGAAYNYSFGIVWVKEALTAVFPVALLILSMWYGAQKRKLRAIVKASLPKILSFPGSPGYILFNEATLPEIDRAAALRSEARELEFKFVAYQRARHQHPALIA